MASTIPSSFRRGEKKSATGANNLRTVKAAFASSPQLPQIRKSGESIAAKKSAIELRIDLVNKSEYNFEDREQHFLPFASASRFWVLFEHPRALIRDCRECFAEAYPSSASHLRWLLLPPPLSPLALPSSRAVSPYEGSS
jgi:hypothetical protein